MNTSWGLKVGALCALVAVAGCKSKSIFPSYTGLATETGHVQEDITPTVDGRVTVRSWDTQRPHPNARATVTELREHRYRIALAPCNVEVEMVGPDYNHGQVVVEPTQGCEINIDHYRGPMLIVGDVQFIRDDRTIQLLFHGTNNQVSPHIRWSINYNGRAE